MIFLADIFKNTHFLVYLFCKNQLMFYRYCLIFQSCDDSKNWLKSQDIKKRPKISQRFSCLTEIWKKRKYIKSSLNLEPTTTTSNKLKGYLCFYNQVD